mmetsp:Transcript_64068/g.118028  ORF Transcript_64068/g.118028 Transcript_64068/m.118028 type:complete len:88 (+) Transcript_64068:622-885(+)
MTCSLRGSFMHASGLQLQTVAMPLLPCALFPIGGGLLICSPNCRCLFGCLERDQVTAKAPPTHHGRPDDDIAPPGTLCEALISEQFK